MTIEEKKKESKKTLKNTLKIKKIVVMLKKKVSPFEFGY